MALNSVRLYSPKKQKRSSKWYLLREYSKECICTIWCALVLLVPWGTKHPQSCTLVYTTLRWREIVSDTLSQFIIHTTDNCLKLALTEITETGEAN